MYNWDESGSWNDANCEKFNDWLCQIRAGKIGNTGPEFYHYDCSEKKLQYL